MSWTSAKVDDAKKGAFRGRGELLDCRVVKNEKRYQPRKWGEDGCARLLPAQRAESSAKQRCAGRKNRRRVSQAATMDGSHGKNDDEKRGNVQKVRAKQLVGQ